MIPKDIDLEIIFKIFYEKIKKIINFLDNFLYFCDIKFFLKIIYFNKYSKNTR